MGKGTPWDGGKGSDGARHMLCVIYEIESHYCCDGVAIISATALKPIDRRCEQPIESSSSPP